MNEKQRLKEMMARLGVSPNKQYGQNFLISDQAIAAILEAVDSFSPEHLIEVGPGLGALTYPLVKKDLAFKVIELDPKLAEFWQQEVRGKSELIFKDALKFDWSHLECPNKTVFVSNLPYEISSRIVLDRSVDESPLKGMVLMFQKEVAQRILAAENSKDYGFLSVMAQEFWQIEKVIALKPGAFFPAPKIHSQVLKFTPKSSTIGEKRKFLSFVKSCFAQRRKVLYKSLSAYLSSVGRENPQEVLHTLPEKVRAEQLPVDKFVELYHLIWK